MNNTYIEQNITNGVYTGPIVWKGDLVLWAHMHNLTSLGRLQGVTGSLDANGCSNLVDLGDLTIVENNLDLEGCSNLTTLGRLDTVNGSLDIEACSNLVTLGKLTTVRKHVYLTACDNLASIGNLQGVRSVSRMDGSVRKRVRILGDVFIERAKHLQSLPLHEALNALHSKEVQSIPLYHNILINKLQGHNTLP